MMDCIFCKIVNGDIPSNKAYEDDKILAFHDISPMAKVHILVIPKEHIASVDEVNDANCDVVAHIFKTIPQIAKENVLAEGYRVITNIGENGGQTVKHLHFHILGGEKLCEKLV
ncbi:MAG: histidine triad nucleotide-binding protein [Oscillospiraceae bacterium]|nr:histidine triad nucleotide-binding protein [Oscillospiraceae bacterium]